MNINQIDTTKLTFDIRRLGEKDNIFTAFPELDQYEEFKLKTKLPRNRVIKTIILLYDKGSELRTAIDDPGQRKRFAAEIAGFECIDEKFSEDIENFLLGRDLNCNRMIIRYCRMQHSGTFASLIALELQRDEIIDEMYRYDEGESSKDKEERRAKLFNNLQKAHELIAKRQTELLANDTHPLSTKSLYIEIEEEKLRLSPEYIAHKKKDGEQIVDILPYGEEYDVEIPGSR